MAEEQLSFIIADLRRFTSKEVQALALDVQANLREDTPRDTGWARANWIPSVGTPLEDATVALIKDPTPADVQRAGLTQQQAMSDILSYDLARGPIFTTNNVPYIIPLNEGHSAQAGAGFVQRSVGRALAKREGAR